MFDCHSESFIFAPSIVVIVFFLFSILFHCLLLLDMVFLTSHRMFNVRINSSAVVNSIQKFVLKSVLTLVRRNLKSEETSPTHRELVLIRTLLQLDSVPLRDLLFL